MNIRVYIEQAINGINADREAELRNIEQRLYAEKIAPFNAEADARRDKALEQKAVELDAKVTALKNEYARAREEIISANEVYKKENREKVISSETAAIKAKYDAAVTELQNSLNKVAE